MLQESESNQHLKTETSKEAPPVEETPNKKIKLSEEALETSSEKVEKSVPKDVARTNAQTPAKRKKGEAPDENDGKVKDRKKNPEDGGRVF